VIEGSSEKEHAMLKGRRIAVVGGSGALGSEIVKHAVVSGGHVFAGHGPRHTLVGGDDGVRWMTVDATDESSVQKFFEEAKKALGSVDIVINTVGSYAGGEPVTSLSVDVWDRLVALNLRSAFLVMREALRTMGAQSYGRIIQIAALSALEPSQRSAAYAVSKAATVHLAEIAARETAKSSIRIHSIAPRIIDTPANRRDMPEADWTAWVQPSEICRAIDRLCDPAMTESGMTVRLPGGGVVE
jgi:NAD(P)-dependent dehydrogenase (short-subunit alcohol dehydrogenase family)